MDLGAAEGQGRHVLKERSAGGSNPSRSTNKQLEVRPIKAKIANAFIVLNHYSARVVPNSQIHFGVFLHGKLKGVLQYGPPMVKRNVLPLVRGTKWNEMLELNRLAFHESLPKNAESRCIAITLRILKKQYPSLKWVLSYADATQCGDGTIYRASNFVLTGIKKNSTILKMPDGSVRSKITFGKGKHGVARGGKTAQPAGAVPLKGFQLRYIYFLDPAYRKRLTVAEMPFSEIEKYGASMYKGKKRSK